MSHHMANSRAAMTDPGRPCCWRDLQVLPRWYLYGGHSATLVYGGPTASTCKISVATLALGAAPERGGTRYRVGRSAGPPVRKFDWGARGFLGDFISGHDPSYL